MIPTFITAGLAILDKVIPDAEAKDKAKRQLLEMQHTADAVELEARMSAIVAEATSEDPWTSRARPSFLYVIYFVILLCVFGAVVGIWYPEEVSIAAQNLAQLLNAIPEMLWGLFGAGYLGYAHYRSTDKKLKK